MSAVVVAGLGYVGLPLAMRAVAAGHDVTGYETDLIRVKRLKAGESCVEDVPAAELAAALESGRFRPSAGQDACAGFDVAVVSVLYWACAISRWHVNGEGISAALPPTRLASLIEEA